MNSKFEVTASETGGLKEVTLVNRDSEECLSIIPDLGCRINNVSLRKNDVIYSVVRKINSPDLTNRDNTFNNVKLFPYANRVKDGTYTHGDKTYNLPLNYFEENNSAHGFVYNRSFEFLGTRSGYSGSLLFRYDYPGDLEGYPFRFSLLISFILKETGEIISLSHRWAYSPDESSLEEVVYDKEPVGAAIVF